MTTNQDFRAAPKLEGPPAGYFLVVPPEDAEASDAIDVAKIFRTLRAHWVLLACTTLVAGAITAIIVLNMRNVYRAQAVLSPTKEEKDSGGGLKSELGGIAELAGIGLGGEGSRKAEALATLMAPGFVREFIQTNNLMPILFSEKWDAKTNGWRAGTKPPTIEQGIKRFTGRRQVDENTKTGMVTLRMDWYSPELAAQWVNGMVALVNERLRKADIITAQNSLDYLNQEMAKANAVELRQAISHLMETQENNAMMAKVQQDYAYHFIDAAVPPLQKNSPMRTVLCLAGALIGFLLGAAYVILRRRASSQKARS
jgi:LPS O-antigen subunit length determinant protein (WzzB/FepE family)